MAQPTSREVEIGRFARTVFGGKTSVHRFSDDTGGVHLFMASGDDCPVAGVMSYATIGLSNHPISYGGQDVKVEVVGACSAAVPAFGNVVASCAIERIKNDTPIHYGSWIDGILDQYGMSTTLRHVTFVSPFLWEGFEARAFEGETIHWLMAVPISDGELEVLRTRGIGALEATFERAQIDIFDIQRASIA